MPPPARGALLDRVGAEDAGLRGELESLIRASESSGTFLEPQGALPAGSLLDDLAAGTLLGPWRIVRLVGRGGMGEVYEAERATGDYQQRAAVKVMRRESAAQLERFNAERQLLARLDHPGIARLLDGGIAPDGRPYFVMEYIDGPPINKHCDAVKASLAERIALFVQVCDAVAYAHRHLIVHRDIKPANVLVDGNGRARLLDFGIAKPLDVRLGEATSGATAALLTPDYAAPEQLCGEPITTATDVHALGVLLFELLTGRTPWATGGQPLARAVHAMLERAAPRPSAVAVETAERPVSARALEGDMDAIVAKCLRREAQHRYATVEALQLDVRRSLEGEAVLARGDARLYVLGRFVRRHRWAVAAVAALFAVLSAGVAATTWQARRAESEAARAEAVRDFLIGVFKASDPRIARDKPRGQITARELLDASVSGIDTQFASDPPTRIQLLGMASEIYRELDEEERYAQLQQRHLNLARQHYGEAHPIVLSATLDLAARANDRLDRGQAMGLLESLDPLIRRAGADRTVLRARWWLIRGQTLFADTSRTEEQLAALSEAERLFAAVAPDHPERVTTLADIGTVYNDRLQPDRARELYDRATALAETVKDRNDAELATIYGNLGQLLLNTGDFAAAEEAYRQAEQVIERTYGKGHGNHWFHAAQRARAVHLGGDRERARALFTDLLANIPAETQQYEAHVAFEWYGTCLAAEGLPLEAISLLERAEQFYRHTSSSDIELPRVRLSLGDAYDRAGRVGQAREALQSTLERRAATIPPEGQALMAVRERWGRFLLSQGDVAGAEEQFVQVTRHANGRKLAHVALAHGGLARVALARGDVNAALAASATALELFDQVTGFRDVRMGPQLWLVRSEALRRSGDRAAARQLAQKALEARRRFDHPSAASIAEAEAALEAATSIR